MASAACGVADEPDGTATTPDRETVALGPVIVTRALVVPDTTAQSVVVSGGSRPMVSILGGRDAPGDTLIRSSDGGDSWEIIDGPVAAPALDDTTSVESVQLWSADDVLVARVGFAPQTEGPQPQTVLMSTDQGDSWFVTPMPAPDDFVPALHAVVALGGDIVAVGALEPAGPPRSVDTRRDYATWRASAEDRRWTFVPVAPGASRAESFDEVITQEGVLFALGESYGTRQTASRSFATEGDTVIWESHDVGRTWTQTAAIRRSTPAIPTDEADHVLPFRYWSIGRNAEGRWSWVERAFEGARTLPGREDGPITRVDGVACDCDVAVAGRIVDSKVRAAELDFEDCETDWSRGDTDVGSPFTVGDVTAAYAACNHRGYHPAALALTDDGGRVWTTSRLTPLARPGHELHRVDLIREVEPPVITVGDTHLLVTSEFEEAGTSPDRMPRGALVLVRVEARDHDASVGAGS
jgi:hypothetical protein